MTVIAAYCLIFESFILLCNGLAGAGQFAISFVNHVGMLAVGIMGLKFRDDAEKQRLLAGISAMQTAFCLFAVFVRNTLWITLKTIAISEWLSIACSIFLLVYYIKGAVRVKRENFT